MYSLYLSNALYSKYYYSAEANGYYAGGSDCYLTLSLYDVYYDSNSEIDDLSAIEAILNTKTSLEFKSSETAEASLTEKDIKGVTGMFSSDHGS